MSSEVNVSSERKRGEAGCELRSDKSMIQCKMGKKKSDRKAEYTKRREARIDPGKKGRTVWKGCYSNQKKQ